MLRVQLKLKHSSLDQRPYCLFHKMSPPKTKDFVLQEFIKEDNKLRILIATVAFGMGIDVKNVTFVINWNAPRSFRDRR